MRIPKDVYILPSIEMKLIYHVSATRENNRYVQAVSKTCLIVNAATRGPFSP